VDNVRGALAGVAFAATIALSLATAPGTAWAASIDAHGATIEQGRGRTPAPPILVPRTPIPVYSPLGVTWED
jgi:hypothetical protein